MLIWLAWTFLALGVLTALCIALDVARRPQPMAIMNLTWPITGLYMPLFGWWVYRSLGRAPRLEHGRHGDGHHHVPHGGGKPGWKSVFVSATHCGGGCTLGDIVTAPLAALSGFSVLGSAMLGHFVLAFIGAYLFGILFQYLPIRAMGDRSPVWALVDAIKADTLSLIAFQAGMYLWMWFAAQAGVGAVDAFDPVFWFMMQIAMLVGFVTSYPPNAWLIARGIKHGM